MRTRPSRAAVVAACLALVMPGAALVAQSRPAPPQRGGQPNQDTPYILVTAFRAPTKKLALEGGDELRERFRSEHSAKELFVITKTTVEGTLTASGYPVDSALNVSDLMELARTVRGEYVTDVTVKPTGQGNAVRAEARLLMKTGTQTVAQPLPPVDAKDVGDAAKQIEKQVTEALKQIPMYKGCIADLRAGNHEAAATKARAGIAAYPNAAWSRVCLLTAYGASKTAPPDSIVAVAERILAVDSTSQLALVNLGEAYKAKGDKDKMIATYMKMYALDKTNRALVVGIYNEVGPSDPGKVLPILDEALKDNPGDPEFMRYKLVLQLQLKDFKNAYATYDELAKTDTSATNLDMYNRMIGVAQTDSNTAKIIEYATKASAKYPNDVGSLMLLSQTYYRTKEFQKSMDAAARAAKLDPKNTGAWQFAMVAAKELNMSDSVTAIGVRALAAGADKAQIAPMMLAPVQDAVNKAQTTPSRDAWRAALKTAETADSIAPSNEAKFFIGFASYSVAADIVQEMQPLTKGNPKPAERATACTLSKEGEENLAKASTGMMAGGRVKPEIAAQILGNISSLNEYVGEVKKVMCAAPAAAKKP